MKKQDYIQYLQDTSDLVSPRLSALVEPYRDIDHDLYDILLHFMRRRINKPLLKPALVRVCFELFSERSWEDIVPACAAFEMVNISSYQANSAFDSKLNILSDADKDSQFIAAMLSRELAHDAICDLKSIAPIGRLESLQQCISDANKWIYVAQHYDLNLLTVANLGAYEDEAYYLQEYTKRCFYGSGVFSGLCALAGGVLAGASDDDQQALKAFGEAYGLALHVINDLGDYIPPTPCGQIGRAYQDQFSDLRNGRLTLPLYHLLTHASSSDKSELRSLMDNARFDNVAMHRILQLLDEYQSIAFTKRFAHQHMEIAKGHLRRRGRSIARAVLGAMTSVSRSNKYYWAWHQWVASNRARERESCHAK